MYICLSPYIKTAGTVVSILTDDSNDVVDDTQTETIALDDYKESESETQPESIEYSPDMRPKQGQAYAQLHCERLNLHENIFYGDDSEELDIGLGQYMGSGIFGFGRTILIGGHHGTAFLPLKDVQVGDVFNVVTSYGKLYEWAYNQELTLDPSTAYTLKLIAGNDKVQPVSFSVAPWKAGNGENGEKKETD